MRDHDDAPTVVIEKETGGLGSFVLGALVGAGVALLFAPRTGEETRQDLERRAREWKTQAEGKVRDAQSKLEGHLDEARGSLQTQVEHVKEAVETGRRAAQDARVDLEHRLERSKAAYRAGVDAARATAQKEDVAPETIVTPDSASD